MRELTIVIVNWNVRDLLRRCLESLDRHLAGIAREVIVVDNASTDGSVAMLAERFPEVTVIESPENVGFARAMNRGAELACGEYLWLLNPDTELLEDSFTPMRRVLDRMPGAGIAGPRLADGSGTPARGAGGRFPGLRSILNTSLFTCRAFPRARWAEGIWLGRDEAATRRIDWVSGAAMLVRREAFEAAGGFDGRFFLLCEDIDLCRRALRHGWRTYLVPETTVVHHEGSSIERQDEELLLAGASSLRTYLASHHGPVAAAALSVPLKGSYLARLAVASLRYARTRSDADRKRLMLVRRHFRMMS